jgi:hypothetical protein
MCSAARGERRGTERSGGAARRGRAGAEAGDRCHSGAGDRPRAKADRRFGLGPIPSCASTRTVSGTPKPNSRASRAPRRSRHTSPMPARNIARNTAAPPAQVARAASPQVTRFHQGRGASGTASRTATGSSKSPASAAATIKFRTAADRPRATQAAASPTAAIRVAFTSSPAQGETRQRGDALSASGRPLPGSEARPQPDQREGGSEARWPSHPREHDPHRRIPRRMRHLGPYRLRRGAVAQREDGVHDLALAARQPLRMRGCGSHRRAFTCNICRWSTPARRPVSAGAKIPIAPIEKSPTRGKG